MDTEIYKGFHLVDFYCLGSHFCYFIDILISMRFAMKHAKTRKVNVV
ncbi:hypothetical protein CAter10_3654 [Collimonas arenae]|nr:hypothetical protein CAter10_3654 [Collimonas arenae]